MQLSRRQLPGGNFSGGHCLGGNYPVGNYPGGQLYRGRCPGGNYLGGNSPRTKYRVAKTNFTTSQENSWNKEFILKESYIARPETLLIKRTPSQVFSFELSKIFGTIFLWKFFCDLLVSFSS